MFIHPDTQFTIARQQHEERLKTAARFRHAAVIAPTRPAERRRRSWGRRRWTTPDDTAPRTEWKTSDPAPLVAGG
jgi:hypothetical protein